LGVARDETARSGALGLGNPECRRSNHQTPTDDPDRGREFLAQLGTLNFRIEPPPLVADLPRLQVLSDRHRLTAYDMAYLDLALRFGLPLATGDSELRRAARVEGIELLG
jgi:predicted nucleic acid-binding protein